MPEDQRAADARWAEGMADSFARQAVTLEGAHLSGAGYRDLAARIRRLASYARESVGAPPPEGRTP